MSVVMARNSSSRQRVAIKAFKWKKRNRDQFNAMKALHETGVDCVKPLYIDHRDRFFVMEWVDAPLLGDQLAGDHHNDLIFRSGQWLAKMQEATVRQTRPRSKVRKIRMPRTSGDEIAEGVLANLKTRMKHSDFQRLGCVRVHGDIHTNNYFVIPDGVMAFDAQYDSFGNSFQDPAQFLFRLAIYRRNANDTRRPWPGSSETDRKSFFEGYGPIQQQHLWMFDLMEDYYFCNKWCSLRKRKRDDPRYDFLETELERRGLIGANKPTSRPGRLSVGPNDSTPYWTCETAPLPKEQRSSRIVGQTVARLASFPKRAN